MSEHGHHEAAPKAPKAAHKAEAPKKHHGPKKKKGFFESLITGE